jgi:hypothetical protein
MSTQPVTPVASAPEEKQSAYDNLGKTTTKNQRTVKNKPDVVPPTAKQESSLTLAVQLAQEETRNAKAGIVRDTSKAIAGEILNDIQNATAMELVVGISKTLTGDRGAGTVLRGFLSTTTLSTFQACEEVAKLETTQPIALQMFQELNLLPAA